MKAVRTFFYKDSLFRLFSLLSALSVFLICAGIFLSLLRESVPALREFGFFGFLFSVEWNYAESLFGAARPLLGSILTSLIAVTVAAPMGIGIAVFLSELCPAFLKGFVGTAVELLAAIPSIIYGMWGLFVFAPFIEVTLQRGVSALFSGLPFIGSFFEIHYAGGIGFLTAGLVLGVMVLPFIAGVAKEALDSVPKELKEAGYGIGCEKWEVVRRISLPYAGRAVRSGIIIALGRALGETMAIAYIIGNMNIRLTSVFDPYVTVTGVLVNEFNEASGLQMSSLFLLALLLFILNFSTLAVAKFCIAGKKS